MEEDFPRGGGAKTAREGTAVARRSDVDNLFQTSVPAEVKKRKGGKEDLKKSKKPRANQNAALSLNPAPKTIEILHAKSVKEGTLLLGVVKEVSELEVTVSLPCGLQGFLSIRNISDAYSRTLTQQLEQDAEQEVAPLPLLFPPGKLLCVVVAKLDVARHGSLSIQLSINPALVHSALSPASFRPGMVLSGSVDSVEDHGFVVDVGVGGTKAFLPRDAVTGDPEGLQVGSYLFYQVEEVKSDGRLLRLSLHPSIISHTSADVKEGWSLNTLRPGTEVEGTVKKVTKHGLLLDFLSNFSGQVDFLHMEPDCSYAEGQQVRARVVYVDPVSRLVGLSVRSFLLSATAVAWPAAGGERIGEVVAGCRLAEMHHMSGAVLELPDKTRAFVHRNHLKESSEAANENRLSARPEHTCRILDFSVMDQIHFATLRRSVIEKPFYRYNDLQAGQLVEGTVSVLLAQGMIVQLSDHIKGLVPRLHLADVALSNPERKYAEGMKVKCRVLSVDPDLKRLYLSRKQSLVDSPLPLFLSFSDARPGRVSLGVVVSVQSFGVILRFYNQVKGLVPLRELSSELVSSPKDLFYLGQVLKAKVLQCDPEKEKLVLSFRAVAEGRSQEGRSQEAAALRDCEVGTLLEMKVQKKTPGGLELATPTGDLRAFLPTMHLSDQQSNCRTLLESLEDGDELTGLVCYNRSANGVSVSRKPSVVASLVGGACVSDFSSLSVGQQLIGWVKNVLSYGVFVEFPHGLTGLAPVAALSERFVKDAAALFSPGQTVLAKVTHLDPEKRRFLLTLKEAELHTSQADAQRAIINALQERKEAAERMARRGGELAASLASLTVGQRLKVTVDSVKEGGVSFKSDDLIGAQLQASKQDVKGVFLSEGQQVSVVVLHVDVLSSCVFVSVGSAQLRKKTLSESSRLSSVVLYADDDVAVVSLGDSGHVTCVSCVGHLNEVFFCGSERVCVGGVLEVEVLEASCEALCGLPLVALRRHPQRGGGGGGGGGLRFGQLVSGTVSAVKPTFVQVALAGGGKGRVHVSEVMEASSVRVGSFPTATLKVGGAVTARVIGGRDVCSNRFLPFSHPKFLYKVSELTLVRSKLEIGADLSAEKTQNQLERFKEGEEITGFVSKFHADRRSLEVTVSPALSGFVDFLSLISDVKEASHPEKLYKLGQAVRVLVVEVNLKPHRFVLSLSGAHRLEQGRTSLGVVVNLHPEAGLLVKLPFGAMGTVALTDLSDAYKPRPLEPFSKDQVLRFFLLGHDNGKWKLSLRPSRVNPQQSRAAKDPEVESLQSLKAGQTVRGFVKSVGEQGVFIRLSRTITGRAELQQSTQYFISDHQILSQQLPVSSLLTTRILSVDEGEELVHLSLLPSLTGKPDILPDSLHLPLRRMGEEKKKLKEKKKKRRQSDSQQPPSESETPTKKRRRRKRRRSEEADSGADVYFREEEEEEEEEPQTAKASPPPPPPRLSLSSSFCWDVSLNSLKPASKSQDDVTDDEEEVGGAKPQKKKSRQEVREEQKETEAELVRREAELMEPHLRPQDCASFERLLLASPDSSLLWLQFMTFHLQATQVEQARAVGERALRTISFREEQEKQNVWVALLNLENLYGSPDSLQKVFDRAVKFCDPPTIHQQLADIYSKSSKTKEAESLYLSMVKRFRHNKSVWLSFGSFLLQEGRGDAAASLLQRALRSLEPRDSVDVISKFAQLEFRYGDAERASLMFDKVLTSYPKRSDLWSVYIDLAIKHRTQADVRALLERVVHLSVSAKKMKFFFKRYLDYELQHGTPQSVQDVKRKAQEFVEARGGVAH